MRDEGTCRRWYGKPWHARRSYEPACPTSSKAAAPAPSLTLCRPAQPNSLITRCCAERGTDRTKDIGVEEEDLKSDCWLGSVT
eukprot:2642028-Rhodomonas_salina.3